MARLSMAITSSPLIPVSPTHPIGSIFEINGVPIHAELDSGWEDDINITPQIAAALGLIHITSTFPDGSPRSFDVPATKSKDFIELWPKTSRHMESKARFWVRFNIPGLPPVRTAATVTTRNTWPIIPLTLVTSPAIGYSVRIGRQQIAYEPAHEGGIPYMPRPWDRGWRKSPEHRTPPFLLVGIGEIEFPALLDTGAIDVVLTRVTAAMVGLNRFPIGAKFDDGGMKVSHIVPLRLANLTLPAQPVVVSNHYPAGNLVYAWHFIQHGFGLTFNPNSLQIHRLPVRSKGGFGS